MRNKKLNILALSCLVAFGGLGVYSLTSCDPTPAPPVSTATASISGGNVEVPEGSTVTLTATLTCGTATKTKSFDVVVAPAGTVAVNYTLIGTIDFNVEANCISQDDNQQVWSANNVTLTNNKASSTSPVKKYTPVRLYAKSSVTIAATGIRKIVFTVDDYKNTYAEDLKSSITTGTVTVDGLVVTVVLDANVDKFEIASLAAQVRLDSVEVYTVA